MTTVTGNLSGQTLTGPGTWNVTGTSSISADASDVGSLSLVRGVILVNTGSMTVSGGGGYYLSNAITDADGTCAISNANGATLTFQASSVFANSVTNAGTFLVQGGPSEIFGTFANTGSIQLLSGSVLTIEPFYSGSSSASAFSGTANSQLVFLDQFTFTGGTLSFAGTTTVSGSNGALKFGASTTIAATIIDQSSIEVTAGTLTVAQGGAIKSQGAATGTILIDDGTTLSVAGTVDSQQTVHFQGAAGTLDLAPTASFTGGITGVVVGDVIDLQGKAATAASYANNVLTITNNGSVVATLSLPNAPASSFSVAPDGAGGSLIGINLRPTVTTPTANQSWQVGQTVNLSIPGSFADPQNQTLTYAAKQSNGAALPSWLTFNAATDTFSGIVPVNAANFGITVTATDQSGLSAAETFSVSVVGVSASSVVAAYQAGTPVASATVSDTAQNIQSNLDLLQTLASNGHLGSIALTDTRTLTVTANQLAADTAALADITGNFALSVTGVAASGASAVAGQSHVSSLSVSDNAANVAANLNALQTLAAAGKLSSINLSSSGTLVLTAAQLAADSTALAAITGNYTLVVTGVSAAGSSVVAANAQVASLAVTDLAANVASNLAALQNLAAAGKLSSIALTDGGTPALSVTAAQLTADATALSNLTGSFTLAVTGVSALNSSIVATQAHVSSVAVSDLAANVASNLAALQNLAAAGKLASVAVFDSAVNVAGNFAALQTLAASGKLASVAVADLAANVVAALAALQNLATASRLSITLTDGGTPTLSLTSAQLAADAAALADLTGSYGLAITGVSALNSANVATQSHVSSVAVSDLAANVASNLAALQSLATAGKLASIVLSDGGTPALSLTAAQLAADAAALADLTGNFALAVSGVSAGNAATVATQTHVSSVAISDSVANVTGNLAVLQNLAAAGKLASIALTGGGTPTLSVTAAQLTADATAVSDLTGSYGLAVTAVSAVNSSTVATQSHVSSVAVSDSAVNVASNLAALQTLAAAGKLASVAVADNAVNVASNLSALQTLAATGKLASVAVSDSAANVASTLSALQILAAAGELTSIAVTGGGTLSLTAAQLTADATALSDLTGSYGLTVTGVSAANSSTVAAQAHVSSFSVTDSAINVTSNLGVLQTLAAAGKMTSIALTDGGTPALSLTAGQLAADATALSDLTGNYTLAVTGASAASSSAVAAQSHVSSVAVFDSAVNVASNLDALQTLAATGKLSSIALSNSGTPALSVTAAQLTADATAISDLTGNFTLAVTGVSAVNSSTPVCQ